ncbi:MAG: DUF1015 domain-containing protein [Candidatus Phosphoribacter sp.]
MESEPAAVHPGRGPRFEPFRALRFAPDTDLGEVTAPPYDVLSTADVSALGERSPHNIVHVDVPQAPAGMAGTDRYAAAAARLSAWCDQGVLVRDERPSLTIYRLSFVDGTGRPRELVGVLGSLEVVDEGAGRVLPHERTTPKASTDRLELTRATRTNLSPVWGLSLAGGLSAALTEPGEPVGRLRVDGVEHVIERVTDPERLARISGIVGSDVVLIADGHHRYGVARHYRDELVAAGDPAGHNGATRTLAFVGELVADQLAIDPIHRMVRGIPSHRLRAALARDFELVPAPGPTMAGGPGVVADLVRDERLLLVEDGREACWLVPRPGAFAGVRALDGAWLEHTLAGSGAVMDYQHGLAEVLQVVEQDRDTAAILIRPTSLAEIERTARDGILMPPKSTFFTPKLRTGLVLRPLDD